MVNNYFKMQETTVIYNNFVNKSKEIQCKPINKYIKENNKKASSNKLI